MDNQTKLIDNERLVPIQEFLLKKGCKVVFGPKDGIAVEVVMSPSDKGTMSFWDKPDLKSIYVKVKSDNKYPLDRYPELAHAVNLINSGGNPGVCSISTTDCSLSYSRFYPSEEVYMNNDDEWELLVDDMLDIHSTYEEIIKKVGGGMSIEEALEDFPTGESTEEIGV
jgi:hypothetical protein